MTPERRRERLDQMLNGLLALIGIQFFLGMWLNLFGSFPTGSGSLGTAVTFTSDPILILHILLGILLVVGAIVLVARSWPDPMRSMRVFSLAGLAGLVFASLAGSGFVYSGYSSGVDSFLMAVGFGVALTAYYEGLVRLRADRVLRDRPTPNPSPA
jgi:heme A synthase